MKVIKVVFDCKYGFFDRHSEEEYYPRTPIEDFDYDDYHIKFSYVPKNTFIFLCINNRDGCIYAKFVHGSKELGEMGDLRVVKGKFKGNPKPVVQFELLDNTDVEKFVNSMQGYVETPNLNPDPDNPIYRENFEWSGQATLLRDKQILNTSLASLMKKMLKRFLSFLLKRSDNSRDW